MDPKDFPEAQTMLCLAALSYRGFEDPGAGFFHTDRLHLALARGFRDVSPQKRAWDLAWGPVSYRAPFSLVDDSVMYVVRSKDVPDQYVIAIRGTNPVSAFDWLFGDLWASEMTPWPYGNRAEFPEAEISFSTALGLNILQQMRSSAPPSGAVADVWRVLDADVSGALRQAAAALLRPIGEGVSGALRKIAGDLRGALDDLEERRHARSRKDLPTRLQGFLEDWRSETRRRILGPLGAVQEALADRYSLNILRLLEGGARLRSQLGSGQDLASFLKVAVGQARGKVDVVVTGHSKGGALASTVALWLRDTQGRQFVREEARWDPEERATVRYFSFAGPTAGNAEFVKRSNARIGERCYRIVNRLDVVPHAWATKDLREVPTLYDRPVERLATLNDLIEQISRDLERLRYQHVGLNVTELPGEFDRTRTLFFDQFVYQHLEGYLKGMELDRLANVATFFSPLE